jgi:hypothetical protein
MAGKHSKPTIIHHGIVGWKENQLSSPYIYQKNQRRKGRSIRKTITEIIFLNTIHKVLHKNIWRPPWGLGKIIPRPQEAQE